MSNNILRKNIIDLLKGGQRIDGRGLDDFRKISIQTGVVEKAEGSALVNIGSTQVIVGVKMDVGEPFPDTPGEGVLMTGAELTAMSNEEFERGPPGEDAIEIARVIDRTIRESKVVPVEKLGLDDGKVWMVFVDMYTMNADGNLIDAGTLGAMAALMTARMPKYEDGKVIREPGKALPVTGKAVAATFAGINGHILVDPEEREESVMDARLTIGMRDGKIVALQKGGNGSFTDEQIEGMFDRALAHEKKLLKHLK